MKDRIRCAMRTSTFSAIVLMAQLIAGCASSSPLEPDDIEDVPLKAVEHVDLNRYMGRWYMISNIPYFAERGNVAARVDYSLRQDGEIDDLLTAQEGFDNPPFTRLGRISISDPVTHAEGMITFMPPLSQPFSIVYVDDTYQYTVVAHPSRNFCWIFSRKPRMSDEAYQRVLDVLKGNLFDVSRVLKIAQTPDQAGTPGFQ